MYTHETMIRFKDSKASDIKIDRFKGGVRGGTIQFYNPEESSDYVTFEDIPKEIFELSDQALRKIYRMLYNVYYQGYEAGKDSKRKEVQNFFSSFGLKVEED